MQNYLTLLSSHYHQWMILYQNHHRYNFFYPENTEITDVLLYEAQQQDPVIWQLFL